MNKKLAVVGIAAAIGVGLASYAIIKRRQ